MQKDANKEKNNAVKTSLSAAFRRGTIALQQLIDVNTKTFHCRKMEDIKIR